MPYTMSLLPLKDYRAWKSEFDSPGAVAQRRESGQGAYWIFRAREDPYLILLLIQWRDLAAAQDYLSSATVVERYRRLLSAPAEIRFLELLESGAA